MSSSRITLNSDGDLSLPTPDTSKNSTAIATTEFVRNAIGAYATVTDGSITTSKIADSGITTAKITDSGVTTSKIADSGVTTAKIADKSIISSKLASSLEITDLTVNNTGNRNILTSRTLIHSANLGGEQFACAISANGQYQVIVRNNFIRYSTNYGATWNTPATQPTITCYSAVMTDDGSRIILAHLTGNAITSTDYGATWSTWTVNGNYITNAISLGISTSGTNPERILYAKKLSGGSGYHNADILLSTDGGNSFTTKYNSLSGAVVGVSKDGITYAIRTNSDFYVSRNYGANWTTSTPGFNYAYDGNIALSATGQYMIATLNPNDFGTYISRDYGVSWSVYNFTTGYKAGISGDGSVMVVPASQGYGRHWISTDFGYSFTQSTIGNPSPTYARNVAVSSDGTHILITSNDVTEVFKNTLSSVANKFTVSGFSTGIVKSNANGVLSTGSVGSSDIAANAVLTSSISDGQITSAKITDAAITSNKIAAGAITSEKLDSSLSLATFSYVDTAIANLVSSAPTQLDTLNELASALGNDANFSTNVISMIADKAPKISATLSNPTLTGTVTLPANTILTSAISDSQVTGPKIAASAITSDKIATGAVTATKIGSSAVITSAISDLQVTGPKIATGAVTSDKIATGGIKGYNIENGTINSTKLYTWDGIIAGVTGNKIADFAITENKIATSAVTTDKIATSAVTASKLDSSVSNYPIQVITNLAYLPTASSSNNGQQILYIQEGSVTLYVCMGLGMYPRWFIINLIDTY